MLIATVLRSGSIYTPLWVQRLSAQCKRWAPPHEFVCLADCEIEGVKTIPLLHRWGGWWSKLELFRTDLFDQPVVYLDLDTLICGPLDDLFAVAASHEFTALTDFYRGEGGIGSGVMGWRDQRRVSHLFEEFSDDPIGWQKRIGTRGDQGFIEENMDLGAITRWQAAVPDQIVSYKVHCRNGIPPDARVVCLHGRPKFADMRADDPVRLAWEQAA